MGLIQLSHDDSSPESRLSPAYEPDTEPASFRFLAEEDLLLSGISETESGELRSGEIQVSRCEFMQSLKRMYQRDVYPTTRADPFPFQHIVHTDNQEEDDAERRHLAAGTARTGDRTIYGV